jgi:hypothetical protein
MVTKSPVASLIMSFASDPSKFPARNPSRANPARPPLKTIAKTIELIRIDLMTLNSFSCLHETV